MTTAKSKATSKGAMAWLNRAPIPPTEEEKAMRNRWELLNQLSNAIQSAANLRSNDLDVPTTLKQTIDILSAKVFVAVQ